MSHKCPWCNSENNSRFLELKDYFLTQEDFEILECNDCKLLFTNPCPTPDKIGDYYKSEDYLSHNESKKGIVPTIYNLVKKVNIKNKFNIAKYQKENDYFIYNAEDSLISILPLSSIKLASRNYQTYINHQEK